MRYYTRAKKSPPNMIICKGLGVLILRHFAAGCFGMGLANNFCSGKIEDILNHLIFRQGCL